MTLVAGIDAGGTKLAVGLVERESGRVLDRSEVATQPERGGAVVLADCERLVRRMVGAVEIAGIGLGVPELVSLDGAITSAALWDWRDGGWQSALGQIAPVVAISDVRAAAVAEARFGAGLGRGSFLYVSIGTGISHALVIDGVVWEGARGNAVVMGAPPIENQASGAALQAQSGIARVEALLESEEFSQLVETAAHALGIELARMVNALDPAALVIGGGLGLSEEYRTKVVGYMRPEIYADSTRAIEVIPAALGKDAGIIGAALATLPERGWARHR